MFKAVGEGEAEIESMRQVFANMKDYMANMKNLFEYINTNTDGVISATELFDFM